MRVRGVFGDVRVIITTHLQALLCSSHMTETVATRVKELLTGKDGAEGTEREGEEAGEGEEAREGEEAGEGEEESEKFTFKLSLQMISWPHLGRAKEVIIALLYTSQIILQESLPWGR